MARFLQLLAFSLAVCNAGAILMSPKRDGIAVTWLKDSHVPLTVEDAKNQGYTLIGSNSTACANGQFLGYRYMKNNDSALIMLYGVQGYVAGIQTSFPKRYVAFHNMKWFENTPLFSKETLGGRETYTLTAYFITPSEICTVGRNKSDFELSKSGTGLYLQNGPTPLQNFITVPIKEGDVAGTPWVKGRCFPTMGVHYWYNTSYGMDCDTFQPVFLLYNHGELTGFGWAVQIMGFRSGNYEFPPIVSLPLFFSQTPWCILKSFIQNQGVSTMHVFLSPNYLTRHCI